MRVLVTAGNTVVPIDQVRCITNLFTGRTGTGIALEARQRGHAVTLLTSHPNVVAELGGPATVAPEWRLIPYRTFEDLQREMASILQTAAIDAVIHSAAVSDYRAAGVYAPAPHTRFRPDNGRWESADPATPGLVDRAAAKVKSDEPELWLRLVRTPKLIDRVRTDWGFAGLLVKFKLEVGVSDEQLLAIAEQSRQQSDADLMAANTLEGSQDWVYLGPLAGHYQRLGRKELPAALLAAVEQLHAERTHG
jgi:phosphopantothenoylcysteine synthetase/decarboxylase